MEAVNAATTDVLVIDIKRALLELSRAVETKGASYVYTDHFDTCTNFESTTGEPRCIVGHVLHALGVTYNDCRYGGAVPGTVRTILANRQDIRFTKGAILILTAAQTAQDAGTTWGMALEIATASGASIFAALEDSVDELWPALAQN